MSLVNTIIFDFDGLLADSEPIYLECNKKYLSDIGISNFSIEDKLFGMRAEEAFQIIKENYDLKQDINEMIAKRNAYMIEDFENGKLKLMPYALETIKELSKKYTIAIGSSSQKVLLDSALRIYNIRDFFETIVCGDDVEKGKPEPDIYLKVAENIRKEPSYCVVIEDSPHGITSGKKAGMKTVAIPNKYTKKLKFLTEPDYIINSLNELENIMIGVNGIKNG